MAVGKESIKRAAKAVEATAEAPVKEAPAKKPAAKKAEVDKNAPVGIGTALPAHLL